MSKSSFPQALHDFSKSNGSDTGVSSGGPSLTRQEFAEECDINSLMKRYEGHVTGGPGNMAPREPLYFDFADAPQDLLGYLEFIKGAEDKFMSLPAIVRREFDNSAVEFVAFASDPGSIDQMREWGLAPPAKPLEPVQVDAGSSPPESSQGSGGGSTHGST